MDDGASPTEQAEELTSRLPEERDLVELCRGLNAAGARYLVIGGFAIINAGYPRTTSDIDLLIDVALDNEAAVKGVLATLPDNAVREMLPGEVARYQIVRVADEVTIDLMASACGLDYWSAEPHIVWREVSGVRIPFASPRLLWAMKATTHREKDQADLIFLRQAYSDEIFGPDGKVKALG